MRLIDADALKDLEEMEYIYFRSPATVPFYEAHKVWEVIDNAPTIEAEPVKHGRWLSDTGSWLLGRCSQCREIYSWDSLAGSNYCPNCGAKMQGDSHD